MPELAHREWEHLFEPWFATEAPSSPAVNTQVKGPEALFEEASQPLAVRRQDYVRRQSPLGRAAESRSGQVAAEVERLVAYVERRHLGVEPTADADRVELPPLRDAPLRRLHRPRPVQQPLPVSQARSPGAFFADGAAVRSEAPLSPHLSGAPVRGLMAFASIALVALYVVYVQMSAAEAMTRATAAERTAAEVQRTAQDAVAAASDRANRAIAEALAHAARAERMIEVMAAPDARRIELSGRAAAPGAVGHALCSQSRGIIVSATGITHLQQQGHVYQVWAATSTGSVSLGLASPDAQGRITAAYDVPSSLAGSIRRILMTLEPVGGSSSPTGQVALSN